MRLDEVRHGAIYVDTNVLYAYLRADPRHVGLIRTFLERVVTGSIEAFVGIPVIDELYYRLLLALIRDQSQTNPLLLLREHTAELVRVHSPSIEEALKDLVSLPHIHLVGVEADDVHRLFHNAREYGLLPRDAIHVAIMQRLGIRMIASDDTDFDHVEGIERHWIINAPR